MDTDTVRVGIVGSTPYAQTHMQSIRRSPGAALTAMAARDLDRARSVAREYEVSTVFAGFQDMLESDLVDAVVIVAPDELHEPISVAALDRGVHVLCEKPLATDPAAAQRMTEAAERSGLVNMSYFALRTTPHHQWLKSLVDQGTIGPVRSATLSLAHGFFRSPEYNWRFDAERGGGVIADLGCYLFDLARWYVGEVSAVAADGAAHVYRPRPDGVQYPAADDSVTGVLHFDGGAHATFDASVVSTTGPGFQRNIIQLQGEHGRLELVHTFSGARVQLMTPGHEDVVEMPVPEDFDAPSGDEEFIRAIISDQAVSSTFADGWRVQRIISAAENAARTRTWITLEEEDSP